MNMSETLSNRGNIVPWLVPIAIGVAAFALAACSTATPSPTPEGTESAGPELQGGALSAIDAEPSSDWRFLEVPAWEGVPGFSLRLPPGWKLNELQGIDSYVGEVVGDGVRLVFDYGAYSPPLNYGNDPEAPYSVFYDTIGGVEAKLVTPTGESGGITGVYFKHLGGPKLTMWGEDLAPAQQQVAFAIFRSIRSLGQSGSTKGLDDV